MKEIIEKAREYVKNETGNAVRPLFNIANKAGQELAEKLNADKDIIMLGTLLMDVKLKQAMKEDRVSEHVEMSIEAAKEFLGQFDLGEDVKNKILKCVEEHHGRDEFDSLESEICCNADCYKFLSVKGFLRYLCILSERENDFQKAVEGVLAKMNEKQKALSLDICKQELEPYYIKFKEMLEKAKESEEVDV